MRQATTASAPSPPPASPAPPPTGRSPAPTADSIPARAPRHPLTALAILGALIVVGLAAANLLMWVARQSSTERQVVDGAIRRVVVETAGDVTVAGDDPQVAGVHVEIQRSWTLWQPEVESRVDGDTLTLVTRCRWPLGPGCRSDYQLRVPPATELRVRSWTGDAQVRGTAGPVDVAVSAGDVTVTDLTGEAVLRSAAGSVTGSRLRSASVDADSGAGEVDLGFDAAPQRVDVNAGAGDATVRVPPGSGPYRVDVPDRDGNALVQVDADPAAGRSIAARSGAGEVRVSYR